MESVEVMGPFREEDSVPSTEAGSGAVTRSFLVLWVVSMESGEVLLPSKEGDTGSGALPGSFLVLGVVSMESGEVLRPSREGVTRSFPVLGVVSMESGEVMGPSREGDSGPLTDTGSGVVT